MRPSIAPRNRPRFAVTPSGLASVDCFGAQQLTAMANGSVADRTGSNFIVEIESVKTAFEKRAFGWNSFEAFDLGSERLLPAKLRVSFPLFVGILAIWANGRNSIFQFRYEPEAKPVWPQSSYRLT